MIEIEKVCEESYVRESPEGTAWVRGPFVFCHREFDIIVQGIADNHGVFLALDDRAQLA